MKSLFANFPAFRFGSCLVFFVLLLGGCGGGGYGGGSGVYPMQVTLTSISITPTSATIISGTTATLTAIGSYSDGSAANITTLVDWTSVAPATASVGSNSGVVSGNVVGMTTVRAAMNAGAYGVIASPAVNVTVTGATLNALTVAPLTSSTAKGTTTTFTATGTFSDSSTGDVSGSATWTSSDTTVATINGSGIATGVGAGTTTITATLTGIANTASLTVF